MSTSSPLVHDRYQPESGAAGVALDEDPWRDEPCGLKKYKRLTVALVFAFFAVGFALIIWVSVTKHQDDAAANAASSLPPYTLTQMFDSSLSPQRASLAWLASPPQLAAGAKDAAATPPPDQFISVMNGSFYLTTLTATNTSFAPVLLIDVADLNRAWPAVSAVVTAATVQRPSSRRLMDASSFDATASGRQGSRQRSAGSGGRPTNPRTLRPKPGHLVRSQQPHSAHHEAQNQMHQSMHTMAATANPGAAASVDASVFVYQSYALSPDQHAMLFGVNCLQLYRHSSFCTYLVYDIAAKTMSPLVAPGSGSQSQQRLAQWSPTSGRIAYVQDDNIFVATLNGVTTAPVQVTTDGLWDHVCNGVADWVYEEEIFEATSALWWSPSGDSLAFLRFNQTLVPLFQFEFFTQPYNEEFSYKYPLPGFANSIVDIKTWNASSNAVTSYPHLRSMFDYEYVMNVAWFDATQVMIRVENRAQNEWRLYKLGVMDSSVTALSSAKAPYYFEPHSCLTSLAPLPLYVDLVNSNSARGPGTGDHLHLATYSIIDGDFDRFLTSGDFDVLSLDAVKITSSAADASTAGSAIVYYTRELIQTAAKMAVPTLWATSSTTVSNGSDATQLFPTGSALTSQAGSYAPSGDFVLLQENAGVPRSTLYALNAGAGAGAAVAAKEVSVLADNAALVASLSARFALPTTTYFQIASTLPGLMMSAQALAPAGVNILDCSNVDRKRPVLIYAYSGPGSQQVTTAYPFGYASQSAFHASLVSNSDYIVMVVDSVGTKGKGESYRKSHTYLRLGLQERADLIEAARWASSQCWADSTRISYWGWSYGAFLSSFVAAAGTGLYSHIVSVAPVTSWALYDSVYTERYMQRPIDNPQGYANSSVIAAASTNFDAQAWRLFGGTADDNVHFQNSALLVDALINLDMPLNVFYFPNRAHSLLQWKTGAPPRYLYESLQQLFAGSGGPNGNGALKQV